MTNRLFAHVYEYEKVTFESYLSKLNTSKIWESNFTYVGRATFLILVFDNGKKNSCKYELQYFTTLSTNPLI